MYECMELIIIYLTGPMSVETWTRLLYAFMAVEVSSHVGVGALLGSTDETPKTMKTVISKLEHQSGIKLKCLRTDNGT
jgi:hypothetical protein